MNLIPNDIARCDGRFGLGPNGPICPRRDQCARYRQMAIDRANAARASGRYIWVFTGLCQDDDYMIPMEAE